MRGKVRRPVVSTGLLCALAIWTPAAAPAGVVDNPTARRIDEALERNRAEVVKIRRFIHMNPELAGGETETAKLIAAKLVSLGLDVKTGVAGTGVVGLLRGRDPGGTLALRADMDALPLQETVDLPYKSLNPGIMHAGGNDIHTAAVLGAAMVLAGLKDAVRGSVKFIFQPASEGCETGKDSGASAMVAEGVLDAPPVRAVIGFHVWPEPLGRVYVSGGPVLAGADWFQVTVKGRTAHGARPYEGIDAIILAAQTVVALQAAALRTTDPQDPAALTVGEIEGGSSAGLIADRAVMTGTVRALSETGRRRMQRLIENVVRGVVSPLGAEYALEFKSAAPPVVNLPDLVKAFRPTLAELQGKDSVFDVPPQAVSDDFGFFSQKAPGFFFLLGVRNPRLAGAGPLHSPSFNPDERSLPIAIRILCHLVLDGLNLQSQLEPKPPAIVR
ncbi:MAG: amidohydrolase [Candidatus Aminicenantes bacterium]|nr:amidohydrolase [Candidatus Aminicenantes bacterium]